MSNNTKKQFYKSNFYFFTDIDINVSNFEETFILKYPNLKFKLYVNDCPSDNKNLAYSLYLNDICDKDLFNAIIELIFKITNAKFNILYKRLDIIHCE
jgi:hypothetical protein